MGAPHGQLLLKRHMNTKHGYLHESSKWQQRRGPRGLLSTEIGGQAQRRLAAATSFRSRQASVV